jgi:hypothetical protein
MKNIFSAVLFLMFITCSSCIGQSINWQQTTNWKIYRTQDNRSFSFTLDTLKKIPSLMLNETEIHALIQGASNLIQKESPLWMGNYVLSFDFPSGVIHKIEVSTYGGFYFEYLTKQYYSIPATNRREWLAYLSNAYERFGNKE